MAIGDEAITDDANLSVGWGLGEFGIFWENRRGSDNVSGVEMGASLDGRRGGGSSRGLDLQPDDSEKI